MGVYLSKPITEKVSSDCSNSRLKCGASSMQGWRISQEDAHNCCLDFDDESSLFAVYDGHGGHEVAEYTAIHLPDFLKTTDAYKNKDFTKALSDAFLGFDGTLTTEPVIEELRKIASKNKEKASNSAANEDEDCDEDADNVEKLKQEAVMPIPEVMSQYTRHYTTSDTLRRFQWDKPNPISPFLKAKSSKPTSSESDNEVSSSNDPSEAPPVVNGVAETNGEVEEADASASSSSKAENDVECLPSSSQNGEIPSGDDPIEGSSRSPVSSKKNEELEGTERAAKKKASSLFNSLLEETSDESDSENDESFHVNDELPTSSDDDNDAEEAGGGDDDDDDDDDDDEEDDEEDESDEDYEVNEAEEPGKDSGCTAVVTLINKDTLYVANAGDSRAVLCRGGEAIDMSLDHKPEDGPEMERIKGAGGKVTCDGRVNGGLNLSRAIGDHTYKQVSALSATEQMIIALPDVKTEKLDPSKDEFIVLACDGIWNSLSSQQVVDFIRPLIKKGEKLSTICEKLFDKCLAPDTLGDGTGCDNMTCVIVQMLWDEKPEDRNSKRPSSPLPEENAKRPKEDA